MHRNEVYTDTIRFYNVWDSVMTFKSGSLPPAIKIVDLTREVQPRTEGYVVYSYSAAAKNDWGSVWDQFTLQTNDPLPKEHNNYKTFYIITDISSGDTRPARVWLPSGTHRCSGNSRYRGQS